MIDDIENEIMTVLNHYELGHLVRFERNERGYVNTNFAIEVEREGVLKRYFLRRYKSEIGESDIEFEHSVIQHLHAKGFKLVASIVPTLRGETFIRRHLSEGGKPAYYALFEFLSGEDRYTCVDPHPSREEIAGAAVVLAQFHQAVSDLKPRGHKTEAVIFELLGSLPDLLESSLRRGLDQQVEKYLLDNAAQTCMHIERTIAELENLDCEECPRIVIHCDYHPGNLQFRGDRVSALFDFDWSKIDARSFDIGLALFYFFASWGADHDGHLRVDETKLFLEKYQDAFLIPGEIGPLTASELRCLPAMIQAGNLYVLNWALLAFGSKAIDPTEAMLWIKHGFNTIRWLEKEANHKQLRDLMGDLMKEIDG